MRRRVAETTNEYRRRSREYFFVWSAVIVMGVTLVLLGIVIYGAR